MDSNKALETLNEKWKLSKNCECCGGNHWTMQDKLTTPTNIEKTGERVSVKLGEGITPQITVICTNCGNTKIFNALVLGLIKSDGSFV
jgi:hypothetical protein